MYINLKTSITCSTIRIIVHRKYDSLKPYIHVPMNIMFNKVPFLKLLYLCSIYIQLLKKYNHEYNKIPLIHNRGTRQMLEYQTLLTLTSYFTGNFFTVLRENAFPVIFVSP